MSPPKIKMWRREKFVLVSPPIRDKNAFRECKQFLTRCWIQAECDEKAKIFRIPVNPADPTGRSNIAKLEKLGAI